MYLVVGLGNPGSEFRMTRHNIGFEAVDYIAVKNGVKINKLKFKGMYGETRIKGEKVIFLKPQTYMNLSGDSISEYCEFFKIPPQNVIVVVDDMSLERGRLRIRTRGGAGGHNGLKSIIYKLQTEEFIRIRIGIGSASNANMDMVNFVIGKFKREEVPVVEKAIIKASEAIIDIVENGVDYAMNKYNTKV